MRYDFNALYDTTNKNSIGECNKRILCDIQRIDEKNRNDEKNGKDKKAGKDGRKLSKNLPVYQIVEQFIGLLFIFSKKTVVFYQVAFIFEREVF